MSRIERISDLGILYLGDYRDILPSLAGDFDILSDLPYGLRYSPGRGSRQIRSPHSRQDNVPTRNFSRKNAVPGDDVDFDPKTLLEFTANNRIIWGANNFASKLPDRQGWLFWDKHCAPLGLSFAEGELAWTDLPITAKAFRHLWNGICKASETGQKRVHPTQKPVALMSWCISLFPSKTSIVVDPGIGSGTTGVAALRLGRKFIGVEKDPAFFDVALRRLRAEEDRLSASFFPPNTSTLSSNKLGGADS